MFGVENLLQHKGGSLRTDKEALELYLVGGNWHEIWEKLVAILKLVLGKCVVGRGM
jgi:hypothetical protein